MRAALGDGVAFAPSYDVLVRAACGQQHAPKTLYDSIADSNSLKVGSTQTYCIRAYSKARVAWAEGRQVSPSYQSEATCKPFQIRWEAQVHVTVVLPAEAGTLPVPGTAVSWTIGSESGLVLTKQDGTCIIQVKTTSLLRLEEEMVITVAKESSNVQHTYHCQGITCTSQRILLRAFEFNRRVAFTDTSSRKFDGYARIAGTGHASSGYEGCPLPQVLVCLHNRVNDIQLGCATTRSDGYYALPVPIGLEVAEFSNHTFRVEDGADDANLRPRAGHDDRVNNQGQHLSYHYYTVDESTAEGMVDFYSTTKQSLRLAVAGGKCNQILGTSRVQLTYATCIGYWSRDIVFSTFNTAVYDVPAHKLTARVIEVEHDDADDVVAYFEATRNRSQAVDLELGNGELRWEYHPAPTLKMILDRAKQMQGCDHQFIPLTTPTALTVTVVEEFWGGEEPCSWVNGNITITNKLGESPELAERLHTSGMISSKMAALLTLCHSGCEYELRLDTDLEAGVDSNAHVTMTIASGEPETVATVEGVQYAKLISATMKTEVHEVSVAQPVIVTGKKIISELLTMEFPEYFPLTILYATACLACCLSVA